MWEHVQKQGTEIKKTQTFEIEETRKQKEEINKRIEKIETIYTRQQKKKSYKHEGNNETNKNECI